MSGVVPLLLGSASPRRRRLLAAMGVAFEAVTPRVREVHRTSRPRWTALENARRKLDWCRQHYPGRAALTADTVVAFEGRAIGKPASLRDAAAVLKRLGGCTHRVLTAVAYGEPGRPPRLDVVVTHVTFRPLTHADVRAYLAHVDPLDKAGGYDIDDHGHWLVSAISGSRANVAGLPVERLREWGGVFTDSGVSRSVG